MSVDETIAALKIRTFDKGAAAVAAELSIHPDTLRSILGEKSPGWLATWRKIEALVAATPATGAAETGN